MFGMWVPCKSFLSPWGGNRGRRLKYPTRGGYWVKGGGPGHANVWGGCTGFIPCIGGAPGWGEVVQCCKGRGVARHKPQEGRVRQLTSKFHFNRNNCIYNF